jgi:peptidoglycan/LPS O-acetylase OafA/YrhL
MKRLNSLDGLRGILALSVVTTHMLDRLGAGKAHAATSIGGHLTEAAKNFVIQPGPFAVFVFFVISGFVLAGALDRPRLFATRWYWPATRYLRLTLPMAFALLVASLLRTLYGDVSVDATPLTALRDAFWSVYADRDRPFFDFVIWSMRVELLGSFLLFAIFLPPTRPSLASIFAAGAGVFIAGGALLVAFTIGAWLYERHKLRPWAIPLPVGMALATGAIALAILNDTPEARYYSSLVTAHSLGNRYAAQDLVAALAGGLLVLAAVGCTALRAGLSTAFPAFLGRISYSLYLIHAPILLTIFGATPSGAAAWEWGAGFLAAAVLAGWLMTLAIDEPATRLIGSIKIPPMARKTTTKGTTMVVDVGSTGYPRSEVLHLLPNPVRPESPRH